MITKRLALLLLASALFPDSSVRAQAPWPERPVRLVTPSQPGGSPDLVARVFAEALAQRWGQSVVVENRPGADGVLAVQGLRDAATSDSGHVLLVAATTVLTVTPVVRDKLSFNPLEEALPVSTAAADFLGIAVPAASSAQSLSDLAEAAKVSPGTLNWYAVPGGPHMVLTNWIQRRGVQMTFVPYRGAPDALRDLGEARIQVAMAPLAPLLPLVKSGKVRLLAVSNPERAPRAPEVPTVQEAGYPELTLEGMIAFFAPSTLGPDQRRKLAADVASAGESPTIRERLAKSGQVVRTSTPEALAEYMTDQTERWRRLAQEQNIKATP